MRYHPHRGTADIEPNLAIVLDAHHLLPSPRPLLVHALQQLLHRPPVLRRGCREKVGIMRECSRGIDRENRGLVCSVESRLDSQRELHSRTDRRLHPHNHQRPYNPSTAAMRVAGGLDAAIEASVAIREIHAPSLQCQTSLGGILTGRNRRGIRTTTATAKISKTRINNSSR